jgi:hypothetical protein
MPERALLRGAAAREIRKELESLRRATADLDEMRPFRIAKLEKQLEIERDRGPEPEPEVWAALLRAKTAEGVRRACGASKRWLNPRWQGRIFVEELAKNAEKFARAKKDPFYPRSKRRTSDKKRAIFFARAMAGIVLEISPITAVDRLRKLKHGEECPCIHCDEERKEHFTKYLYYGAWPEKKKPRKRK